jgi:outer membrane protein, heavy metal efflux system
MKAAIAKLVFRIVAGCCFGVFLVPASRAQETTLTLERALDMARTRAPVILSARARIEEARGRLKGASVLFQQNPSIEAEAGPRLSSPNHFTDMDVALMQEFELGGRRKARIAGAEAGVARETADSGEATRRLLREVASSFSRALAAQERVRLLATAETLAQEFLQIAERRYRAGDVAILEVNLSRTSLARARAERRVAVADRSAELGELRVLLGMKTGESIAVAGDLHERGAYDQSALLARSIEERPDFQALQAELREAEADVRLGEAFKWPDLGLGARYRRDTGDNIYQGGLKITLPVFSRGQELRATGNARASRVRLEMEALRNAVQHEIASSVEAYEARVEASGELERGALPSLSENENLAKRSYEEGEIGIAELLLIRKETLDTRLAYVNSLLDAKLAEVEMQFRAGVLR